MKITYEQEAALEANEHLVPGAAYPWGEKCPACGRPHLFLYTDGTKLCDKCDEVIFGVGGMNLKEAKNLRGTEWKIISTGAFELPALRDYAEAALQNRIWEMESKIEEMALALGVKD